MVLVVLLGGVLVATLQGLVCPPAPQQTKPLHSDILLGVMIAPSRAGGCLAVAAFLAFLARTPFKLVLVDAFRRRMLPRTKLAAVIAGIEISILAVLIITAERLTDDRRWWIAVAIAAPLVMVEFWFEARARGGRALPEIAGALAIAAVGAYWAIERTLL